MYWRSAEAVALASGSATAIPGGARRPIAVTSVVYRTVQEALTNVLKHAHHPTRVRVALMYGSGQTVIEVEVEVEVEDDGAGLPAEPDTRAGDRHGLTGMAERIAAYGGRLHAVPVPGRGWCLRATVPTPEDPAPDGQQ